MYWLAWLDSKQMWVLEQKPGNEANTCFLFFVCSVTEGDLVEVLKMQSAQKQVCAGQNSEEVGS